ncbi:hypothetical protein GMMP15_830042 [Candidatus Magnetomoraceae bacterium gMMP-15]
MKTKDYKKNNYSLIFKNIPHESLRKFDLYEDYCGKSGDYNFDICNISIKYFEEEINEQKSILDFLSKRKIELISINAIESIYSKYSKYDDIKEFLASKILTRIKQKNSIQDLHEFNTKYKDHKTTIKSSIEKLYELIKIKDSVPGYEWFIKNYSNVKYTKEALERIHGIMFNKAQKVNTVSAYNSFIFSYPTAKQVEQANKIANEKEREIYTNLGLMSFWDTDHKREKKSRQLLIKSKQIERFPRDNNLDSFRRAGYFIVVNRMYELLQEEFNDTDATLRHLESQEFKDFVKSFKNIMENIKYTLEKIQKNISDMNYYTKDMLEVSKKGFADAKADSAMSAYYTQKHRKWEKFMHYKDTGYN